MTLAVAEALNPNKPNYYWWWIGSYIWSCIWRHCLWPWVTLKGQSRSQVFNGLYGSFSQERATASNQGCQFVVNFLISGILTFWGKNNFFPVLRQFQAFLTFWIFYILPPVFSAFLVDFYNFPHVLTCIVCWPCLPACLPVPDSVLPASQGHEAGHACVGYDRDTSAVFDRVPLPLSGQRFMATCGKSAMFVVSLQ